LGVRERTECVDVSHRHPSFNDRELASLKSGLVGPKLTVGEDDYMKFGEYAPVPTACQSVNRQSFRNADVVASDWRNVWSAVELQEV